MNDKIAKQIEEMKKQTIGVEVEMNSITRQKAAQVAAWRRRYKRPYYRRRGIESVDFTLCDAYDRP